MEGHSRLIDSNMDYFTTDGKKCHNHFLKFMKYDILLQFMRQSDRLAKGIFGKGMVFL